MILALQTTARTKCFPGVLANDHVNFSLERGEIHALLGENRAGKSTLMNIMYRFYQPDEGEICIQDQLVKITSPHDAIKKRRWHGSPRSRVQSKIRLARESLHQICPAAGLAG
jgi:ABC-type uncharacterized transport system ATPase subunit